MTQSKALPEGLSADDLMLSPDTNHKSREGSKETHVHPSPPHTEDEAFDHTHSEHHPVDHSHELHHAAELQPSVDGFVDGWQLGLYRDAVIGGALAAAALALLGVFIVLRRAVFAAATVGQAAGLGVVVSFYAAIHWGLELPPVVGALAFCALATGALALRAAPRSLPQDAVLGLGFLIASAAAIALGDRITQEAHEVAAILFGTAVVVSSSDVTLVGVLAGVVALAVLMTWRGLAFAGFDPDGARVQNLPVRPLNLGFWLLVAVAIAICTRVLGALPVFAFSVLPPLAAILSTRRLGTALVVSAVTGAGCAALGYVAAYFLSLPVGATQALCCAAILLPCGLVGRLEAWVHGRTTARLDA